MTSHPEESTSSLTVERESTASRQRVWDVIADGWTYSQWVVGNSRMRAVDPRWPEPGSVIHHSIGVWPVVINDSTRVESCDPGREIVLIAKGRPVGTARITLRLHDLDNGGCRIEMAEVAVSPPMSWLPHQVTLAAVFPRNRETLWRLAAVAERRASDDT
ncbi:Polyketide cyclase / dehydrase and lipid transport [Mycolicibacterium chubuense NBB4]|uniref:Polyketide cyclase / dehydrase and lipid transport n=1 Tax=Mycolicibacterium chubuense (strain NBB4) TaxID=710421 RepID=I4BKD4_MYCCN|nr:SRPBCC family protein [Mycolicibacterium chubuense]AFM17741.1 Polyketide cyclase / dehydrase and lipid transport [Mycolicibacterium chubuense NBB4]